MITAATVAELGRIAADMRVCHSITVRPHEATALLRAVTIADECSVSEIESSCEREKRAGVYWYDVAPELDPATRGPEEVAAMQQALDHLTARGLLVRDESNPNLVSFKPEAA